MSQSSCPSSARRVSATTGICAVRGVCRELAHGLGAIHVREPEVHQDHVGQMLCASAIPSRGRRGLERPKPGRASTSRASFRFCSLSSTIRTSGSRRRTGRILRPCRSGSCSPRTTTSFAKASVACSRREPEFEVAAVCGDLDSLLDAVERRTGCRRHRHPHAAGPHGRGHPGAQSGCARPPGGRRRRAQPVREPELRARTARGR